MNQVLNQPPVLSLPLEQKGTFSEPQNTSTFLARKGKNLFNASNSSILAEVEPYFYSYDSVSKDMIKELQNTTTTIRIMYRDSLRAIANVGYHLLKTKEILKYGEFEKWVEQEFTNLNYFSLSTAENYMNLARMVNQYGAEKLKELPLSVIYIVARQREDVIEKVLEEAEKAEKNGEKLTRKRMKEIKQAVVLNRSQKPTTPTIFNEPNTIKTWEAEASAVIDNSVATALVEKPLPTLLPAPVLPSKQVEEATAQITAIENEEKINYRQINFLTTEAVDSYQLILAQFPLNRESLDGIETVFTKLKFALDSEGLLAIYTSPFDIATVFYYANQNNFKYVTAIAVEKESCVYPDYNITNDYMSVLLFSFCDNYTFVDNIQDFYSSHELFLNDIVQSMALTKPLLFFKYPETELDLLDEDTLFKLATNSQLTVSL